MMMRTLVFALCAGVVMTGVAQASPQTAAGQPLNLLAISMFGLFVLVTLAITWWAAGKTRTASDFYTAGGGISGNMNGLAIAGDYMSAATLLGTTSLIFAKGYDGFVYLISAFIGWPIIMFLMAERLRNLGRYTFADIASFRLEQNGVRTFAAFGSLTVVCFYLVVQMVGAGQLIQLLFGLEYHWAVIIVGGLMMVYVIFGGMVATTWVQVIKAALLLGGGALLLAMTMSRFGFSLDRLFTQAVSAHKDGIRIMGPGSMLSDPVSAISLGLGMMFGTAGMPHILMRFFTVADAQAARKSVFVATGLIGFFFLVIATLGVASIVIVGTDAQFFVGGQLGGALVGGSNMPVMHLARAVGGDIFFGFLSAVAFATILAVVSGLVLAGASSVSHDIYARVIRKGEASMRSEVLVSRGAAVVLGVVAIVLGIAFKDQNVAFLVSLTFGVAASVNFPILILSMYWKGLTTRGALAGGMVGLVSSVSLVVMSPAVWVKVFGNAQALVPYDHPALFSMSAAFAVTWLVSVLDRSARARAEQSAYVSQFVRGHTGIGADGASTH